MKKQYHYFARVKRTLTRARIFPARLLVLLIASAIVLSDLNIASAQTVTRGPYLQLGTSTSVVVRWRTSTATDSRVRYGASPTTLTNIVDSATVTTGHAVTLTGLTPDTLYYYSVGSTAQVLAGGDSGHFFATAPTPGVAQPTRIWVIGDSGSADANAAAVRDAYLNFTGTRHTNLWLMLGDNAYESGTDLEFQNAVFHMYPTLLRQSVLWPSFGNHDALSADSPTQTGPYYDIVTLPKNGEAGGIPSGTEAYYSFDFGNIHFVVLDSSDSSTAPNGAMLTWLTSDLAMTTQPWIIAYWHHTPYSKALDGSHDSDNPSVAREVRENVLPILEAAGVDLVLTGHAHWYQRSYLLDGHYGLSSSFAEGMKVDGGSGRVDDTGPYEKSALDAVPHEGTVYAVVGSSGRLILGGNHPTNYILVNKFGSLVLDIDGNRLDARFIDDTGAVGDYFTIMKGGTTQKPQADYDDDRKSDVSVYQINSGNWFHFQSTAGFGQHLAFGGPNYLPVPGDYDGDGVTDTAVYDTTNGNWFIAQSMAGFRTHPNFGGTGFIPVPGDYDDDGLMDVAVYQTSTGNWFMVGSTSGFTSHLAFGGSSFVPVPGDYDGDGQTDVAVYETSTGNWFMVGSTSGFTSHLAFGGTGFVPVPGDYDGDGKTDVAVYEKNVGNWFYVRTTAGFGQHLNFGGGGYMPVPGDYDGDGRTDRAVYQTSTGHWFIAQSTAGFKTHPSFGGSGFVPVLPQVTILRALGLL